jgi:hypothetical protein
VKDYCSLLKFGPNMKTAHGPLAQTLLHAPSCEVARSRKQPTARWRASALSRFQRCVLMHKRCTSEILGPTTRQLAVVRVLPARLTDPPLVDPRPTVTCEVMQVSIDPYSFSFNRVTSFLLLLPQPRIYTLAWL